MRHTPIVNLECLYEIKTVTEIVDADIVSKFGVIDCCDTINKSTIDAWRLCYPTIQILPNEVILNAKI